MPSPPERSLFDVQVNGFAGVDFQQSHLSAAAMRHAVEALAAHQTRRFFVTLMTDSLPALEAKLAGWERARKQDEAIAEAVCGYHLEGPWISPEPGYCGAHDPSLMIAPHLRDFARLQHAADGRVRLVTLAPELPGAAGFIRALRAEGVHVSIGHSMADQHQIEAAIGAGARFCTHLGNGVPLLLDRHRNVVQHLLACDELTAFLIPDGIHLPTAVLKNFFRAKPKGRALFTTDCMAASGSPPGRYRLGRHELEVGPDAIVRLPGSAQFAGSSLTPPQGVANAAAWLELPPAEARSLHSTAAAEHFGIDLPYLA